MEPIGMTAESIPADGDPRRLLSEARALAHRVRLDLVLPMNSGFGPPHWGIRARFAVPRLAAGAVLLLGAVGFRAARRRQWWWWWWW
jgi:hypothetical protein